MDPGRVAFLMFTALVCQKFVRNQLFFCAPIDSQYDTKPKTDVQCPLGPHVHTSKTVRDRHGAILPVLICMKETLFERSYTSAVKEKPVCTSLISSAGKKL